MSRFVTGQTALIAVVPEAKSVVGALRASYDLSAQQGVPAHVTVLIPFLGIGKVDAAVRAELADIRASVPAFDVKFTAFRRLTAAVAERWPEHPPYGGEYDDVVPHLTVAEGSVHVLDLAEAILTPQLPVRARIGGLDLIGFDGHCWSSREHWMLGGA